MIIKRQIKGEYMNIIIVVPDGEGKFKVLHNYLQHGISYSTKELAESEAEKLRKSFGLPHKKKD